MLQNLIRKTQTALAWFALVAALSAVVVVLGSYLVSASQPYRGPSLFYFYLLFFAALISRKWSTALLIFALPLLPDLAMQAQYIRTVCFVTDVRIGYEEHRVEYAWLATAWSLRNDYGR